MNQENTPKRRGKAANLGVDEKSEVKRKRRIKMVIIIIILIIALFLSRVFVKQVVEPVVDGKKPLSILLVGTDGAAMRDELWGDEKAELTDSIMIITFNPDLYKFEATSIPRDTSIDYTTEVCQNAGAPEWQDQINELYYVSGNSMDCLESAITNVLNVPIDYYVKVNMDQLVEIIDSIGGIEVVAHAADGSISEPSLEKDENYTWYDGETYQLSGKEALSYARARHDSEKDYGRGIRQQQIIAATMLKVLNGELSLDVIKSLFDLVETDMAPALIYQYYSFVTNIGDVLNAASSDQEIDIKSLNKTAWLSMFEHFGYDESKVDKDTIAGFEEYMTSENVSREDIKNYFFVSHQFFNETYSGHYNFVLEQLQTISDALRTNLGLEVEEVFLPSAVYGDNEASGLTPMGWATSGGSSSNSSSNTSTTQPTTDNTDTDVETDTEVETDVDSDGDGILDSVDICAGFNDNIDTDADGTPDGCDETPNGDVIDTDGDGVLDDADICPGFDDSIDTDLDGTPDGCDETPNGDVIDTDGDGVADDVDVCEGFDDNIDSDGNGTPDGCDEVIDGGDGTDTGDLTETGDVV